MKIVRIVLLVAGVLLLVNVFFVPRVNIGWYLQLALGLAVIAYGVFFHKIPKKLHIVALCLGMIPVVFVGFLAVYGNINTATHDEDAVIVLGAAIRGEYPSRFLASRLNTAADYWEQNPESYIVVTGGLGEGAQFTEAHVMARFLHEQRGVPHERILQEGYSISTEENLLFAHEILQEHFGHDDFTVVIVTSDFHLYRAVRLARQVGFRTTRLGAPVQWFTWPMYYLREMFSVVNAWVGNPLTRHDIRL